MDILDGRRFCLLCRDELVNLPDNVNIHPIPCQEEVDNFIPEKMPEEFAVFFHRLTNLSITPTQEQMFLHVEKEVTSYSSARCTGKTTFLLVYIIYKALKTNERYGAVFHDRGFENQCNGLLKKMYIGLTDEERTKLDIYIEHRHYTGRIKLYGKKDPKADTFYDLEIREFMGYGVLERAQMHSDFRQWNNIRPITPGHTNNRTRWHMIFDPLY